MDIQESALYSLKESSEITEIPLRTLQRKAKQYQAKRIDGRYLFLGSQLIELIKSRERKEVNTAPDSRHAPNIAPNITKEIETLKKENEALKMEVKMLKEDLSLYDIGENERLEVFTHEMYEVFESRLLEWKEQNAKIKSQQEIFDAKEKGLNDVVDLLKDQSEHYKNQFNYQKEQSTRILEMHEQLIKTIQQNNYIEAKSKGFDKN
jgi:hypothetical protein